MSLPLKLLLELTLETKALRKPSSFKSSGLIVEECLKIGDLFC